MPGNPALNEKTFARERVVSFDPSALQPGRRTTMSIDGVVQKTALLVGLVVAAGFVGWHATPTGTDGLPTLPVWIIPAALVAFGVAILTFFRPPLARVTAPLYAVLEGLAAGAISAVYEARLHGVVLQAIGLTVAITAALLVAFATGRIRVTPRFQLIVVSATFGIVVIYLVQLVAHAFGSSVPFLFSSGLFGTLFCLAVCFIAASNLLLDFNFIQRGIESGTARHMEWYAGFAVCVHLVWLYLEVLRLLGRLRSR